MATDFTFKNVPESVINKHYKLDEWPQNYGSEGETGFSYTPLIMDDSFIVGLLIKHNIYYSPSREDFKEFLDDVDANAETQPELSDYELETVSLLNDVYLAGGLIDWIEE